jgi:tetratricopeptide (TPR) repeat protein
VSHYLAGRPGDGQGNFDLAANLDPNTYLLFTEAARLHLKHCLRNAEKELSSPGDLSALAEPTVTELIDQQIARHRMAQVSHPNYADLPYRLGLLLRQRGEWRQAVDAFQLSSELNPSYVKPLIKLGLALREAGQYAAAVRTLKKAMLLDVESAHLHYQLGLVFANRSQFELAVEACEESCCQEDAPFDLQANLGLALANIGLMDRTTAGWQAICALVPSAHPPEVTLSI